MPQPADGSVYGYFDPSWTPSFLHRNEIMLRTEAGNESSECACDHPVAALASLHCCATQGIGAFRINSQILSIKTHPQAGYDIRELPRGHQIMAGESSSC